MQVFNTPNVRQYMSESQTWNHHMTSYENDDSNKRVLSFRLKLATLSDYLISISILFQTTRGGHRESSRCNFRAASRNVEQLFLTRSQRS